MNNRLGYIIAATIVVGVLVFGVAVIFQQNANSSKAPCTTVDGKRHDFVIRNSTVTPTDLTAQRCDTLTITNQDNISRTIAFGNHDHHVAYGGIEERELTKDQALTVTLDQVGEFHFHDHLHDEVEGYFTVEK